MLVSTFSISKRISPRLANSTAGIFSTWDASKKLHFRHNQRSTVIAVRCGHWRPQTSKRADFSHPPFQSCLPTTYQIPNFESFGQHCRPVLACRSDCPVSPTTTTIASVDYLSQKAGSYKISVPICLHLPYHLATSLSRSSRLAPTSPTALAIPSA